MRSHECYRGVSRRGRNRTRGRRINSAPSVPTHKPYETGRSSLGNVEPRPPYTGDRRAHIATPSRRFELSEIRRRTSAFGALAGNRTLTGGLRTRCSTNELQAQIHVYRGVPSPAHTSSESGENRTLTAQGKNLARCLYATDSLSANRMFDNECHSKYTSPIGWWARTESNGLAEARRLPRQSPSEDEPRTQRRSLKRKKPPRFPGRLSLKNQYKTRPLTPETSRTHREMHVALQTIAFATLGDGRL